MSRLDFTDVAAQFEAATDTRLVYHGRQLLRYAGTHWREIDRERLALAVRRWGDHAGLGLTVRGVAEVVQALMAAAMTDHAADLPFWLSDGPPAGQLVPFANGLLDLATWELVPHTPAFVCGYCLPYEYDPAATCRAWLAALDAVYEGDPGRIGLLQEWAGYLMSGDTSHHKFLGLTGVGRSLKSTILDVMARLVGRENAAACRMSTLGTRFGLAPLVGKPLAVMSEVELDAERTGDIVQTLKEITGEDTLQIDRKGLPAVSLRLPTRLMFASNRMPILFDGSQALADRLLVLEHRVGWVGREDRELPGRLAAEVEGIAVWALAGLRRLRDRGRFPAVDSDTLRRFRRASASVDSFLTERCRVHEDFAPAHLKLATTADRLETEKQVLYGAYVSYCDQWALYPKSEKGFHGELAERMPRLPAESYHPHGKPRRYRGIGLRAV